MPELNLSPDDLPPTQITPADETLRRQLEAAIARRLYEACDGVTQSILMSCEWYVTTNALALTLVVICPDASTNQRVLSNLVPLGNQLARFSSSAKLRICSSTTGGPFELRVDEVSLNWDSLGMEG
jgi:hypothetical protein